MFRLRPTTFQTIITRPTAIAAIITIVVIDMNITFAERMMFTSIPVRPFSACTPVTDCEPRNVSPGIDAVKVVLVSACTRLSKDDALIGRPGDLAISSGMMFLVSLAWGLPGIVTNNHRITLWRSNG